jgi:hypothetical protein
VESLPNVRGQSSKYGAVSAISTIESISGLPACIHKLSPDPINSICVLSLNLALGFPEREQQTSSVPPLPVGSPQISMSIGNRQSAIS